MQIVKEGELNKFKTSWAESIIVKNIKIVNGLEELKKKYKYYKKLNKKQLNILRKYDNKIDIIDLKKWG